MGVFSPDGLPPKMQGKIEVSDSGCWLWRMSMMSNGYGNAWDGKRVRTAHRYAYEFMVGPIPSGLVIDHLCRVRSCVNPGHMQPVTQRENMRRAGWFKYRELRRECPRHGTDGMVVRLAPDRPRGVRVECRECRNESQRKRRAIKQAA